MIKNYGDFVEIELNIDYELYHDILEKADEKDIDKLNFILEIEGDKWTMKAL